MPIGHSLLSVIVPTLNEASYLRNTLSHAINMAMEPHKIEWILIDAGSTDGTVESVADLPLRTYVEPSFRLAKAKSLNFGLEQAVSNIVLFLDADTLLPQHFDHTIYKTLEKASVVGGAFTMRFYDSTVLLDLLALLNEARYRIWKTYYGDQAIFCRKAAASKINGFPDTLMEAAHLCRAIKKHGKLSLINRPVFTSPRRFDEGGFWSVFLYDVKMWMKFIFKADLRRDQSHYWNKNLEIG